MDMEDIILLRDPIELNAIKVPLSAVSKKEVIEEMADLLTARGVRVKKNLLTKKIWERETIQSTGVGKGVALMHAQVPVQDEEVYVVMGVSPRGIDFDSLDGKPVHIFFLIACVDNLNVAYLQTLSTLARLFRNEKFCREIIGMSDPESVHRRIQERCEEVLKG